MNVYKKSYTISEGDGDCFSKLKLSRLFYIMQDGALHHAEKLGFGREPLLSKNQAFVMSRLKIKVFDMPASKGEIQLKTYPKGIDKLFFIRDYEMSVNGKVFAIARTLWLLIDVEKRRPVRPKDIDYDTIDSLIDMEEMPSKLKNLGEEKELFSSIKIGYSAIDINGHVNNIKYVDWICDCLGSEFFKENREYDLTINYVSELKDKETVSIYSKDDFIEGVSSDNRIVFLTKIDRK